MASTPPVTPRSSASPASIVLPVSSVPLVSRTSPVLPAASVLQVSSTPSVSSISPVSSVSSVFSDIPISSALPVSNASPLSSTVPAFITLQASSVPPSVPPTSSVPPSVLPTSIALQMSSSPPVASVPSVSSTLPLSSPLILSRTQSIQTVFPTPVSLETTIISSSSSMASAFSQPYTPNVTRTHTSLYLPSEASIQQPVPTHQTVHTAIPSILPTSHTPSTLLTLSPAATPTNLPTILSLGMVTMATMEDLILSTSITEQVSPTESVVGTTLDTTNINTTPKKLNSAVTAGIAVASVLLATIAGGIALILLITLHRRWRRKKSYANGTVDTPNENSIHFALGKYL